MGKKFYFCIFIYLFVFTFTRFSYFIYYSIPVLSYDSASYCAVALNILDGKFPVLDIRNPGYPMFLSLIWSFSKNPLYISLFQSLFTLINGVFFIYVINKSYKKYIFVFTISLCITIFSPYFLIFEPSILTEGVFPNLIILSISFIILSLKSDKLIYWLLYSSLTGIILLIKPIGVIFIIPFLMLIIYFKIKKLKFKNFLFLFFPVTFVLLVLCFYNYARINSFTISPFGNASLSGATILFTEQSDKYSDSVNSAIKSTLDETSTKDISYVKNNFELSKLYKTFYDNLWTGSVRIIDKLMKANTTTNYMRILPYIKQINYDAIVNHPKVYFKFFISNFLQYFLNFRKTLNYYNSLENAYKVNIIENKYVKVLENDNWIQVSSDREDYKLVKDLYTNEFNKNTSSNFTVIGTTEVKASSTLLKNIYENVEIVYNILFRNLFWIIFFIITFAISIYLLLKSRFTDVEALIFSISGIIYFTNAVGVSLIQNSLERYSYPFDFIVYLSLPFFFIFIKTIKLKKAKL
jgi:hypothetical protein